MPDEAAALVPALAEGVKDGLLLAPRIVVLAGICYVGEQLVRGIIIVAR